MEKLIFIDRFGRLTLPKAIREAACLGKEGQVRIRLGRDGIIEIRPVTPVRRLKKVGEFLVGVSNSTARFDAGTDVRVERNSR